MDRSRGAARIWRILGVVVGILLGGMLLYAALLKSSDPILFIDQIRSYRVFPERAGFAAYALLWTEFVLGLMLVLQVLPRWSLLGFAVLMLLFIGVTAYAWAGGFAESCGCFGRLSARPPRDVILEDVLYLALGGFAFWKAPWVSRSRRGWMAYALILPLFLAMPWIAPRLPVDSLVTPLRPGFNLETLAADDLRIPLGEGSVFLVFLGDDCRECAEALPMLTELGRREGAPKVLGVFAGDRARKRAWTLQHVPTFPMAHAPVKSLRQYYRRLPVFVLLEDGTVRSVWWTTPASADAVLAARSTTAEPRGGADAGL